MVRTVRLVFLSILAMTLIVACGAPPQTGPAPTAAPAANPQTAPTAAPAAADSCPRPPEMDARFCDEDGDLVADPPKDSAQWVNLTAFKRIALTADAVAIW